MAWLLGAIKLLPELIPFVRELLRRYDIEQAKELIREGKRRVEEVEKQHDKDPVNAARDFWSDGGM